MPMIGVSYCSYTQHMKEFRHKLTEPSTVTCKNRSVYERYIKGKYKEIKM